MLLHEYRKRVEWYQAHRPWWFDEEEPHPFPLFRQEASLYHGMEGKRSRMAGLLEELEDAWKQLFRVYGLGLWLFV